MLKFNIGDSVKLSPNVKALRSIRHSKLRGYIKEKYPKLDNGATFDGYYILITEGQDGSFGPYWGDDFLVEDNDATVTLLVLI